MPNDYTLGRGKVYFADFQTGTQSPDVFRYIGNTPSLNLTIDDETLDHFNADSGIREKDDSVPLEVTRTGTMECDNIDVENLALFFFGSASTVTVGAAAGLTYTTPGVNVGDFVQIGATAADPVGSRGITGTPVVEDTGGGGTTYTVTTDYIINTDTGMMEIPTGSTIPADQVLDITYDVAATTRDRIISGSEPREGAMRFIADNPRGTNRDFIFSWTKVSPNGDYALKGEEWQVIPFSLEFLKPTAAEAIYVDGRPV